MTRAEEKAIQAKLTRVQAALGGGNCSVMQITGNAYAPVYRAGDLVIINDLKPKAHDHVIVTTRTETRLGEYVHMDGHSLVLRRFSGKMPELFTIRRKEVKRVERVLGSLRG